MSPRCTLNAALTLALTAGLLAGRRARAGASEDRRHLVRHRAAGLAGHSRTQHREPVARRDRRGEGRVRGAGRRPDPTRAVSNSHKLISENKVDLIIGSSTTPNTMAMLDTVAAGATPVITLASSARLIEPMDDKRRWCSRRRIPIR